MAQGTIKRLTDRGFGFIAQDGEEKDLFFLLCDAVLVRTYFSVYQELFISHQFPINIFLSNREIHCIHKNGVEIH